MATEAPIIVVEDARIIYRNFAGKEGPYNKDGDRNFSLVVEDEAVAKQFLEDGWNMKFKEPRDEGDSGLWHLPCTVRFDNYPPKIVMVTSAGRTTLDESMVEVLDYSDIKSVDLKLRGHTWGPINDKFGIKAYVKTMYVVLEEDELDLKYSDMERA